MDSTSTNTAAQQTTATASTALARLDNSDLYVATDGSILDTGERYVRDTCLADYCALHAPRNIRRTVARLVTDGVLVVDDGGRERPASDARPTVVRTVEHVTCGRGRTIPATVYYLDERAAGYVLARLRTAAAVDAQRRLADAFLAVRRGAAPSPSPVLSAPTAPAPPSNDARLDRLCGVVESLVGALSQLLPRLVPPAALPAAQVAAPPVVEQVEAAPPSRPTRQDPPAAIPADWESPTQIAARASVALGVRVSGQRVGHVLRDLGYHGVGTRHLRRGDLVPRAHGAPGNCVRWVYSPIVVARVVEHMRDEDRQREATRAGAAATLAAIQDGDTSATTRPRRPPPPSAHA